MKTSTLHARKTIQPSSATMTSQSHLEPIPVGSSPASRDYRNKCQHNIIHTTIPVPKRGKRIVTIASFFWFFCRPIRRSPKTLLQPPAVNEKEIVNFPIVEVSRTSRVGAIEIESPKKKNGSSLRVGRHRAGLKLKSTFPFDQTGSLGPRAPPTKSQKNWTPRPWAATDSAADRLQRRRWCIGAMWWNELTLGRQFLKSEIFGFFRATINKQLRLKLIFNIFKNIVRGFTELPIALQILRKINSRQHLTSHRCPGWSRRQRCRLHKTCQLTCLHCCGSTFSTALPKPAQNSRVVNPRNNSQKQKVVSIALQHPAAIDWILKRHVNLPGANLTTLKGGGTTLGHPEGDW